MALPNDRWRTREIIYHALIIMFWLFSRIIIGYWLSEYLNEIRFIAYNLEAHSNRYCNLKTIVFISY